MGESFFNRLKAGLTKTKERFIGQVEEVLSFYPQISPELYEELEEVLVSADVGIETASLLIEKLQARVKQEKTDRTDQVKEYLKDIMVEILSIDPPPQLKEDPLAILVVGVNGVGKTTSLAKVADFYKQQGKSGLIVAGDTFRAGAIEQLKIWGERLKIEVIHHQEGADPGAVVFDGMAAASARRTDVVIIDTAGRLHTKVNLMSELKKVHRIVRQNLGERNLVNLLVLDATTGQNALSQAKTFQEAVGVDGIILTKLDGTAKGGITLAICAQLGLPLVWVGVGEQSTDLKPFLAKEFVDALFA